jgi:hypothetical protein
MNTDDQISRRSLSTAERDLLKKFLRLEISLGQLQDAFGQMLDVNFSDSERRLISYFLFPDHGIKVQMSDIKKAMNKHAEGALTTKDLSDWAAMLLLNDAYDWSGSEEETISEWLNDISLLGLKPESDSEHLE